MEAIEFSAIPDLDADYDLLLELLANFTKQTGIAFKPMSIPWSGGGSLVVWRHTYGYPDRLEAAFELADFLTRKSNMLETGHESHILPARVDALDERIPAEHPLRPVMVQLVSSSRTYRTIPLWRRIESQFCQELSSIAKEIPENKDADLDTLLFSAMNSLSYRLNLTLE